MRRVSRSGLVLGICAVWPLIAEAQQARPSETPKWEIEIYAGGLFGSNPTGGTPIAEFPVGSPLPVLIPAFTSRSVSSWHFGDGSLLLNQANLAYALGTPSLVPLDAALKQRLAERRSGVSASRNPAVQFSNNPGTGFRSSLSGPAIADLQTFEGAGVRTAFQVTAGYYFHLGRAAAGAAVRQAPSGAVPGRASQTKWEVEGHGGWFGASDVTGGTPIASFPVGEPVVTSQANSRAVSSWMFGDGPVLISQAFAQFGAFTARITPLDGLLQARFAGRGGGGSVGFRVGRQLTSRFGAEFNFDSVQASLDMSNGASAALEQTRASFLAVFTSLFPGGAASTMTLAPARDIRQDFVTGTVNVNLGAYGPARPYVTAGLGAVLNRGEAPSASLDGSYIFPSTGTLLIDESDRVVVRAVVKDKSLVSVVGGGVRLHVSPRQGVRADFRVHLTDNPIDTAVDATPSLVMQPTFGVSLLFPTNPSLQFSSTSARRSSLSGPSVSGLTTFAGEGLQTHMNFSIGYFFRF